VQVANGFGQRYLSLRFDPKRKDVVVRKEAGFWLTVAVLLVAAPILSACNTVHGVGQDLSAAGRGIEHTAEKVSGNK
jgi:predicted small secreted protein